VFAFGGAFTDIALVVLDLRVPAQVENGWRSFAKSIANSQIVAATDRFELPSTDKSRRVSCSYPKQMGQILIETHHRCSNASPSHPQRYQKSPLSVLAFRLSARLLATAP